jgi:membrane dipeptidase
MLIVDLHCDSLSTVTSEQGLINEYNFSRRETQLQLTAAFVPKRNQSPLERRRRAMRFMDIYVAECARLSLVSVTGCHDLAFAETVEKRAAMFTLEGGGGLFADSEELRNLYRMGLRVMGLAWDGNELSASAYDEDDYGLTSDGHDMIDRLSELGIIVDVSHMSDKALNETLKATAYPVLATHSNLREACNTRRNLARRCRSGSYRRRNRYRGRWGWLAVSGDPRLVAYKDATYRSQLG